jgi:hypothetical protein
VENMTDYQYAWMMYLIGAVGCSLATWLLFRRAGRAWVHFFVITVMVILFTPYAVDVGDMIMAPAVYTLVFGYFESGFGAIKPALKVMLGLWIGLLVLSLLYQLLTRGRVQRATEQRAAKAKHKATYEPTDSDDYDYSPASRRSAGRELSREERIARDELLHEEPIRAIR